MPYIKQIVSDFHSLALTAEDLRREMRDRLTVGYQLLAGSVGAEEILARFRSENPDIDIAHVMIVSQCSRHCARLREQKKRRSAEAVVHKRHTVFSRA